MSNDNSAVSTDNISVRFSGGVHHVQVGSMAEGQSTPTGNLTSPAVQVTDTVHSVQFGGANPGFSSQGLSQFDTSDFARDTGSPLSTARNNGFPAGGDLRLDSVIKAGGTELTIENAMHMGWVRQAANGFEWIGPGSHPEVKKNPDSSQISPEQNTQEPPTDQREESQQKLPEGVEPFTPEVEAQVAQAISGIPQPMISEAVVHVLEHGPESLNYDQLASLTGLSAAEVQQRAASVIGAFTAQADSIAKSMGIQEPQELWNWLHTNRGDAMKRAQRDMAFNRDTRMLRQLIQHAKDSLGPDEGSLKAAGYQTHVNDYGELLVNINGAWTLASVAQKMRLI